MTVVDTKVGEKVLMKGTDAIGAAAIMAGCRYYFGYPITPQNEVGEYLSRELPKLDGVFVQSESELAAINMVCGTAATGKRVMTSTSGPGYSLMLEGISNIVVLGLPCVLVLVNRVGPGGGNIESSQTDYTSVTRGGGHGGYHNIVLSPSSLQELFDLVQLAFDLADKYRLMTIVLTEGTMAQMMEPVEQSRATLVESLPAKDWALTGKMGRRKANVLTSAMSGSIGNLYHARAEEKYRAIQQNEVRYETYLMEDADVAVVAFGTMARLSWAAVDDARAEGIKAGLIRPISLWPFPNELITESVAKVKKVLVVEANQGQMLYDVLYNTPIERRHDVHFIGRAQSDVSQLEVRDLIRKLSGG